MKRNKLFLLGLIALFAAILSLSLVSNTFAKYTTNASNNDTARVAHWGVGIAFDGETFETEYKDPTNTIVTVQSTEEVMAPGTGDTMFSILLTGEPEVAVRVEYDATVTLEDWEVESAYYCPIVVTVGSTPLSGLDYADADAFEAAIEAAIESYTDEYEIGTEMPDVNVPNVSWSWAYEGDNAKDTALGDAGTKATFDLKVKTTVTQVD